MLFPAPFDIVVSRRPIDPSPLPPFFFFLRNRMDLRQRAGADGRGAYKPVGDGNVSRSQRIGGVLRNRVWPYLLAIFYVVLAGGVAVHTDFIDTVRYNSELDRFYLNIGAVLFVIDSIIAAFTVFWLKYRHGVDVDEWEKYTPTSIPIASVIGILSSLL
jgi:hypothetical protein